MRRGFALAGIVVALAGGARAQTARDAPATGSAVAPGIRGALVLEPGRIRAGDVAALEIVVTTPPQHRLRPVAPPAELPGFWILDVEALPVEKEDGRWLHRTRVRLRARELGQFIWPAQAVEIEAPDGTTQRLVLEGRPLEVVSVQPEHSGRSIPFGLREPPGAAALPGSVWGAVAAGAFAGGATVALLGVARRSRRDRHALVSDATSRVEEAPLSPWRAAGLALGGIAGRIETEPVVAADELASALRAYGTERWRRDLGALTTPELAAMTPPPGAAPFWPELVALLRSLDEARFAPGGASARTGALREALARAHAFVTATTPPGARD
jgi:hypothetical protein